MKQSFNPTGLAFISSMFASMLLIAKLTTTLSSSTSFKIAKFRLASAVLPTRISHRGDSGMVKMLAMSNKETIVGSASGNLQEMDPVLIWKNPRLIHDSRTYPREIKRPSSTTCLPRCFASEHSACQTGTVAERIPTPTPMMTRPTMN